MTKLSVNVNKIATIRNARGGSVPSVLKAALAIESFGAHGITVHPRPDERHIRYSDVRELKKHLKVEFNVEGYPTQSFLDLIAEIKPEQVTLVPDPPEVLTSNAGWKVDKQGDILAKVVKKLKQPGLRISVFMDPLDCNEKSLKALKDWGVDRIELYTESYANNYSKPEENSILELYLKAALCAEKIGLGCNAGHDLNLKNLKTLLQKIPQIAEVSIGHELIADALYLGLEKSVKAYLACL